MGEDGVVSCVKRGFTLFFISMETLQEELFSPAENKTNPSSGRGSNPEQYNRQRVGEVTFLRDSLRKNIEFNLQSSRAPQQTVIIKRNYL